MQRRRAIALVASAPWALAGCTPVVPQGFATLAEARRTVGTLTAGGWRSSGAWSLAQTLNHLAQSVEYSMAGFPAPKSALFQATVGRAAFTLFDARGRMSHSLSEPIPGAPALVDDFDPAQERLLASLTSFEAHGGPIEPHFAYGKLDKVQATRAHLMHIANHWTELHKQN